MRLSFPLFGRPRSDGTVEWMVVGLGNPGARYAHNRHNVGFHVVDRLAAEAGLRFDERQNHALMARGTVEGARVALVKPQTYMNLSGKAVGPLVRFYKIPLERLLVICDDLDLPLGELRLRLKGGSGGHRGLVSVIEHLGSQDFPRLRIGIGRSASAMAPEVYVLQDFDPTQQAVMEQAYLRAIEAIRTVLREGFQVAMNRFN
ncbi:MAG: aminoacyl-tRNA hydrolase [Anaerolineae bacterium]